MDSPSGVVNGVVPPSACSPWQRAHPKPVGFSSDETWNHISPRSTDRAASSRSSSAFCPGSPSQITASHGAIRSMNATPRAMVRSMCWRSRTSSAGPGRIPGGMSGPRAAARRRMANMMRPPMNARATATPTISARVAAVDSARGVTSLAPDRHAERSLRLLLDRVGATRRTVDPRARVHADQAVLHDDPEPVHPARRRTVPVLPGAVVLRAMAGALEPLALDAEGHPAPEVDALLVQRHEAVADQALVDGARLFALVRDQVEAAGPEVEGLVGGIDLLLDRVRGEVQVDHRSEPAAQVRPHERDAGRAELRGEQPHRGEQRPPEEVTPGDRRGPFRLAGRLGLGARHLPRGGLPEHRRGLPRPDERPHQQQEEQPDQRGHDDDGECLSHRSKNSVGTITPATIGWKYRSSSWRPRKYHGALDGFGVRFGLASSRSGALTNVENTISAAVTMISDSSSWISK